MNALRMSRLTFVFCVIARCNIETDIWAAPSEFGTYRLCEQRRFRRACASAQSRQNLRCSLIQAVSQEEPSDRKPDPWPLWMAGHAQLKFVMTECSKTQIRLTGLIYNLYKYAFLATINLHTCYHTKIHLEMAPAQETSEVSLLHWFMNGSTCM